MCAHSYSCYGCGHGFFIWYDDIEYCGNRTLSAYDIEIEASDMCDNPVVTCEGVSNLCCNECSEDYELEHELDE